MPRSPFTCIVTLLCASSTGSVLAQTAAAPQRTAPAPAAGSRAAPAAPETPRSALDLAVRRGTVLLAGQPSAADLGALRARGIARVINLRTPAEMDDRSVVPFDEAALLQGANVDYVAIPIGGADHPYGPEALEAYAKALEGARGDVLLHCGSGGRASLLHAAYEMKYLGKSADEAMRGLEDFGGWPLPLERLTGIPLKVERRDAPAAPGR